MGNIRKTALYDAHVKYGGKVVEYSGWLLPVQYESLKVEHEAVRNNAGLFDVSHMGEVKVVGSDAEKYLQHLLTNDISLMNEFQVMYTIMCYDTGGVVDDLLVYKYSTCDYLLVINAANVEKDFAYMQEQCKNYNVTLTNISEDVSEVALQGPKAQDILQKLTTQDLNEIKFFYFKDNVDIKGISCLVSRTGYTGEDGFEIYTNNNDISKLWEEIMEAGKDYGLKPCGLGARDTLRFEAILPLYGNELSQDITPLEAGLGFFVKTGKGDYLGRDVHLKQKEEGLKRKIVAFEMVDNAIPRHGYEVCKDDKKIGFVTTGYLSPTLGKKIGLALLDIDHTNIGEEIDILIRNKKYKAKIVKKQFYTKQYKK
ncbi:MAG: glycine cleavage system aminomethyltransferase GcvT [Oscillospiraceae bacterium]|nr:glycine cleavage system aminomethyltransferase GcvT [Oscillospiraceae bacterium]